MTVSTLFKSNLLQYKHQIQVIGLIIQARYLISLIETIEQTIKLMRFHSVNMIHFLSVFSTSREVGGKIPLF